MFLKPSKDDLPGPSIAQIYVKMYASDKEGHILITPRCVSIKELEEQIEYLKHDLETIRKKAKQKFAKKADKKRS